MIHHKKNEFIFLKKIDYVHDFKKNEFIFLKKMIDHLKILKKMNLFSQKKIDHIHYFKKNEFIFSKKIWTKSCCARISIYFFKKYFR